MSLKTLITKYKTELLIHLKYPKRYSDSSILSYVPETIQVGKNVTIKPGVTLSSTLQKIGNYVYIGDQSTLINVEEIGNYSCISHNVKIGMENHRLDALSTNPLFYKKAKGIVTEDNSLQEKPVKIAADVLISADVVILSEVTLGVGCVVGANSFVNKDVPPYAIVAGSPAKIIAYRFEEETRKKLVDSKWWEKDINDLKKLQSTFNNPEEFLTRI
ncbi:MAG TPA: CatB-related O-acetyltransferase [Brumimicrobium sp.]|nr:CatB-related O-acetyltransferase [Brumimicrobium sp.]